MLFIEVLDSFFGTCEIFHWFPRVVVGIVAVPSDKVLILVKGSAASGGTNSAYVACRTAVPMEEAFEVGSAHGGRGTISGRLNSVPWSRNACFPRGRSDRTAAGRPTKKEAGEH